MKRTFNNGVLLPFLLTLALAARGASYDIQIDTGVNLIANQLDHGSNYLDAIVVPDSAIQGFFLSKYNSNTASWVHSTYDSVLHAWSPNLALNPGEGAILLSTAPGNLA